MPAMYGSASLNFFYIRQALPIIDVPARGIERVSLKGLQLEHWGG